MITKLLPGITLLLICFGFSCKKDSVHTPFVPSTVKFSNSVSANEDDAGRYVELTLSLTSKSDSIVKINYSTQDSNALAGVDYTAITNGTLIFQRGETSKTITLYYNADTTQKKDLVCFVNLTNVTNAILSDHKIRVTIKNVDYANLVWSDEFNGAALNTADWNYELGNNNGWGNNELETYTNSTDNTYLANGCLNITATKAGNVYNSARLTTMGKQQFTYGRIDIRAKLPQGKGIWPALWMLGSDISTVNWPGCGEIDIMEVLGHETNKTYGTVHFSNGGNAQAGSSYVLPSGSFSDDFHVFTLIWTPNSLRWLVDKHEYVNEPKNMILGFTIDLPEFFIFNVAVGGSWPGNPDGTTVFPQTMAVDYIRVYQ